MDERVAEGQDLALARDRQLDLVALVALLGGREQVLHAHDGVVAASDLAPRAEQFGTLGSPTWVTALAEVPNQRLPMRIRTCPGLV